MVGNGLQPSIWVQFKEKFALPSIKELYAATEGNITLGKLLFYILFSVWNMSFYMHEHCQVSKLNLNSIINIKDCNKNESVIYLQVV